MKATRRTSGFTLVEVMVVLAIMTLVAGLLGFGLREGDSATALRAGQGIMADLVAAARRRAMVSGARTALVIDADPAGADFLRRIHLAAETAPGSDRWVAMDDGAVLPATVFLVPGPTGTVGVTLVGTWPENHHSSVELAMAGSVLGAGRLPVSSWLKASIPMPGSGVALGATGGSRYLVALGRRTETGVIFDRPESVRGLTLSAYNVALRVDDEASLDL